MVNHFLFSLLGSISSSRFFFSFLIVFWCLCDGQGVSAALCMKMKDVDGVENFLISLFCYDD
jgi:hypothetical protein